MGFNARRFRPGLSTYLAGLRPEKLTVFIELDRILLCTSGEPSKYKKADAVFSRWRKGCTNFQKIKTKPYSIFGYERLASEYETPVGLGGLPFPKERRVYNEKPIYVFLRRHARTFLRELRASGKCQVVVFTRMMKERADALLDVIEGRGPDGSGEKLFDGRLYQENCCWVPTQPAEEARHLLQPDVVVPMAACEERVHYVKSLSTAVPYVNLRRSVLVDFDEVSCAANLKNSMCVKPFYGADDDFLPGLLSSLLRLTRLRDVRDVIRGSDLYSAFSSYKENMQHEMPFLDAERDGAPWVLRRPIHYEPDTASETLTTSRRVCFGPNSYRGKFVGSFPSGAVNVISPRGQARRAKQMVCVCYCHYRSHSRGSYFKSYCVSTNGSTAQGATTQHLA